jgi:hypothetical protein
MDRVAEVKHLLAALVLACNASAAFACGYCVEDKIAAAYDHAVVTRALGQKHHVAFFHIDGTLAPGDATRRTLEALADSVTGVDRGSARASVDSAALSVAFDPQRAPVAKLQIALERKLAAKKVSLLLLQVMDRPADFSPSVSRALQARSR